MTLLTLPEMCARFGQHGRTLFSFLTSREPHSVAEFLDAETVRDPLPTVGLDRLYDFFTSTNPQRWQPPCSRLIEIDTAIRETTGLTDEQRKVLKVVGILNVLSQGGPLRASIPVIRYALSATAPLTDRAVRKIVTELEQRGVLTYRRFADEYRLWQGSDLDLTALVEQAREELVLVSPAELLAGQHRMPPAIAGKHSQRVGMLRYFETVLADAGTKAIMGLGVKDAADGLLVYFLGPPEEVSSLSIQPGSKPVVIATTSGHATIVEAVSELAAVLRALDRSEVQADRVARRELQDRAADARRRLAERVSEHLHPASAGVQFRLAGADEALPVGRGLSSLLSQVCEIAYSASPEISNEMLGRRELTSQAAKARRAAAHRDGRAPRPGVARHARVRAGESDVCGAAAAPSNPPGHRRWNFRLPPAEPRQHEQDLGHYDPDGGPGDEGPASSRHAVRHAHGPAHRPQGRADPGPPYSAAALPGR